MSRCRLLKASLLLIALLPALPAHAWVRVTPEFADQPVGASSYYGMVLTVAPFITTTLPGDGTEMTEAASEESSSIDQKLKLARDDAAAFVGSHGQIRGVMLEAALEVLQQRTAYAHYSDLQLAEALLAYQSNGSF
ncbi:DUF2388 domain-containing protein [Pseudomonas sp. MM211]|uniref:DUF2388 domain-containing protein n=1 Tax=Pseudomonas sp. MM211 TaxID=2866808 RepID=UPI001CEDB49B|nr:DUF2388 domain-containing protein [Pseudomonas sp. MM211]